MLLIMQWFFFPQELWQKKNNMAHKLRQPVIARRGDEAPHRNEKDALFKWSFLQSKGDWFAIARNDAECFVCHFIFSSNRNVARNNSWSSDWILLTFQTKAFSLSAGKNARNRSILINRGFALLMLAIFFTEIHYNKVLLEQERVIKTALDNDKWINEAVGDGVTASADSHPARSERAWQQANVARRRFWRYPAVHKHRQWQGD